MGNFVDAMMTKNAYTANGALTNSTSLNKCLDLFSLIGNHKDFTKEFWSAYAEDPNIALKILFWSRDVRGGSGARMTFVNVFKEMQTTDPALFSKLFRYIPEFGYWKDVYKNFRPTNEVLEFVATTLKNDQDHSLCAKYFPRKGQWFAAMRKFLGCTPAELRHLVVEKTQVVENAMCSRDWSGIDYATVPSVAGLRYKKAFMKHDETRYNEYIQSVLKGEEKINSSVLYPHNIYQEYNKILTDGMTGRYWKKDYTKLTKKVTDPLKAMWNNLPNFMEGCNDRLLPICDVSGSMTGTPMDISVALGCYISERNVGPFKNAFITFHERPQMQYLEGDIIQRFRQLESAPWGGSTNLQAVFDLILNRAKATGLKEEDMPTKLLIISDMHFNSACRDFTNFEVIKQKYASAGYKMPGIIFWNVNGDAGNVPVTLRDYNTGLVSGYSPSILQSIFKAEVLTPMQLMLKTVDTPRYEMIHI